MKTAGSMLALCLMVIFMIEGECKPHNPNQISPKNPPSFMKYAGLLSGSHGNQKVANCNGGNGQGRGPPSSAPPATAAPTTAAPTTAAAK